MGSRLKPPGTTEHMPPNRIHHNFSNFSKRLTNGRMTWMSVLIAGIVFGSLGAIPSATQAAGSDAKPSDDPARLFFAQHCQGCHAGKKPKGDFRLESLSQDFTEKGNRLRW